MLASPIGSQPCDLPPDEPRLPEGTLGDGTQVEEAQVLAASLSSSPASVDSGSPSSAAGWKTVWANQWEPSTKAQHAADCYRRHWDDGTLVNADIATVLDEVPEHDLLVGGFPCQDYSVAKTRNQAHGIEGKKGVLWWSIYSIVEDRRPRWIVLENVDRLLKSPVAQRGRDFAIILACLADLGYTVEWRVVNAAEYGFPQKRRRVFIVAHRDLLVTKGRALSWLYDEGVLRERFRSCRPKTSTPSSSLGSPI